MNVPTMSRLWRLLGQRRRLLQVGSIAFIATIATGCGSTDQAAIVQSAASPPQTNVAPGGRLAGSVVIDRETSASVLTLSRIGSLVAKCSRQGQVSWSFTGAALLPTATIVVSDGTLAKPIAHTVQPRQTVRGTGPQAPPVTSVWQLHGIAKADVPVVTMWLSGVRASASDGSDVTAQAVVSVVK